MIQITNEDNMDLMARYPDKYFELAIVDPPYGIGENGDHNKSRSNLAIAKDYKAFFGGDTDIPTEKYFEELFRVSRNQIIWGGNYMIKHLYPTMGWIFWDKHMTGDFSAGELAWTSFNRALEKLDYAWNGMLQGNMKKKESRIHPTQKPVALYKWLLSRYAHAGDKILDTHLGSGSIAIACHDLGFDLTACELDADYYKAAVDRSRNHQAQASLFTPEVLRVPEKQIDLL